MIFTEIGFLVLGVLLGLWFVYAVVRRAVKNNDFGAVLMLLVLLVSIIYAL